MKAGTRDDSGAGANATVREYASGQRVFGRYTLAKILGRGGMGIVWLARDEKLERDVALKFLPELITHDGALLNDLKRETRRSLELTHKNIVRIYDFVDNERLACISMEYIDGETLSNLRSGKEQKVFEPNELSGWTTQLCDALDYAHNHAKIIHRDLKPANLMVNQKGDLKVSDFGIARSIGDSMSKLTMARGTSGTLVYMSPQQLDGERGTHLDDIYSLGATLYDLLASKPPFYSGNIDRQIHERTALPMTERRKEFNIEPALVPPVWETTVAACLAKDPAKRPQSAAEVAQRLGVSSAGARITTTTFARASQRRLLTAAVFVLLLLLGFGTWDFLSRVSKPAVEQQKVAEAKPPAIKQKSVAVLPFENLSTEEKNTVFAAGIHREVLSNLAKVNDLKVISRSSVMRYKPGTDRNLKQIAEELGVVYFVEGSVQREADHVRITVELIDVRTNSQAWAETYDGKLADALAFQGEIAERISNQLGAKLSPRESADLVTKPTQDFAAFESYVRARALMETLSDQESYESDFRRAVELLEQALARDPKFLFAYCALAEANTQLYRAWQKPQDRSRAEAAIKEAERVAPQAGETILARARLVYYGSLDFKAALATLEVAAKLLPNNADISLTRALLYRRFGRWQEAFAQFKSAIELNPQDPFPYFSAAAAATALFWWDDADRIRERMIKLFPHLERPARLEKAISLRMRGDVEAGNKELDTLNPKLPPAFLPLFYRALWERNYEEARRLVNEAAKYPELERERWEGEIRLAFVANAPVDREAVRHAEKQITERLQHASALAEENLTEALACVKNLLGKKEEAVRLLEEAVQKHPLSEDALTNVARLRHLAYGFVFAGEQERALETFARLVQAPMGIPYGALKYDPVLEDLRKHPRFDQILKQSQQPFPRL